MIDFEDVDGDQVSTETIRSTTYGAVLSLAIHSKSSEDLGYAAWLTRDMARALAADLLAFADSQEPENEE